MTLLLSSAILTFKFTQINQQLHRWITDVCLGFSCRKKIYISIFIYNSNTICIESPESCIEFLYDTIHETNVAMQQLILNGGCDLFLFLFWLDYYSIFQHFKQKIVLWSNIIKSPYFLLSLSSCTLRVQT